VARVSTQPGSGSSSVLPPQPVPSLVALQGSLLLLASGALLILVVGRVRGGEAWARPAAAWVTACGIVLLPSTSAIATLPDGDLNDDNRLGAGDIQVMMRIVEGSHTPTAEQLIRGDISPLDLTPEPTPEINARDLLLLMREVKGEDVDGDGLEADFELQAGASPFRTDSDRDGLDDFAEIMTHSTDPADPDTDGDGLDDLAEVNLGTNPLNVDTDGDGLSDWDEVNGSTNPTVFNDMDGDWIGDGTEGGQADPNYPFTTDPNNPDSDADGLPDGQDPDPENAAGDQIHAIHADHLGSTAVLTDTSGSAVRSVHYAVFGEVRSSTVTGPISTPDPAEKYTGQRSDGSSGLYYYGARYYDPDTGRFAQPDRLVESPLSPQTLNRYTYVRNDPLSRVDPTGNCSSCEEDAWGSYDDLMAGYEPPSGASGTSPSSWRPTLDQQVAYDYQRFGLSQRYSVAAVEPAPVQTSNLYTGVWSAPQEVSQSGTESTEQTGPSPAFVAGVATNAAGLAVGGGEVANVQGGQWRASQPLKDGTRPFYDQRFHGNQYTGGRNAVLRRGAAFRLAGRAFFGVGTALSIGDAYQGNISPVQAGQDITFGAIGTFGGPLGLLVSGSYFGSQAAVEFLGLDPAALRAVAPQPPGY
jgi:RHS repeat-associated protein